ncbi:hypothetical protein Sste5344_001082 [Sporothrix stenoceras]
MREPRKKALAEGHKTLSRKAQKCLGSLTEDDCYLSKACRRMIKGAPVDMLPLLGPDAPVTALTNNDKKSYDNDDSTNDSTGSNKDPSNDIDDNLWEVKVAEQMSEAKTQIWHNNMTKIVAVLEYHMHATHQDRTKAWEEYERLVRTVYDDKINMTELPSIVNKVSALQALTVLVIVGSGLRPDVEEVANFLLNIVATDGKPVHYLDSASVVACALDIWTFAASFLFTFKLLDDDDDDSDCDSDSGLEDEDKEVNKTYFYTQGKHILEVLVDQLDSTDVSVRISTSTAIALLFEASRHHEEVTDSSLVLRDYTSVSNLSGVIAADTKGKCINNAGASAKSTKREGRADALGHFREVMNSLELGVGPDAALGTWKPDGSLNRGKRGKKTSSTCNPLKCAPAPREDAIIQPTESFCVAPTEGDRKLNAANEDVHYRQRVQFGDKVLPIDTWALRARVDTLCSILASGITLHLTHNRRVRGVLEATCIVAQTRVKRTPRKRLVDDEDSGFEEEEEEEKVKNVMVSAPEVVSLKDSRFVQAHAAKKQAEQRSKEMKIERRQKRFTPDLVFTAEDEYF